MISNGLKLIRYVMIMVLLAVAGGCGGTSQTTSGKAEGKVTVKLVWSGGRTPFKTVAYAPAGVATVRLALTGASITPVQQDFPASAGVGTLTGVPVGTGMTLTATGLDSTGTATFQGSVTGVTVQGGLTTDVGSVVLSPLSTATTFSQSDLAGNWVGINFKTGPGVAAGTNDGWNRSTATIDGAGNITITSLVDSTGSTSTDIGGTVNWSVNANGSITESGTAAFGSGTLRMSSNKKMIVGVASDGADSVLRIAVKQDGTTFSAADLAGPLNWQFCQLNSGAAADWLYAAGTADSSGLFTMTTKIDPAGPQTPGTVGSLSVSSSGVVSISALPTFYGIMTPDKRIVFGVATNPNQTGEYMFVVMTLAPATQTFALSDLAGTWNSSGIKHGGLWEYFTGTISATGAGATTSYLNSAGDTSLDNGLTGVTLTMNASGGGGISFRTDVYGFLASDKSLIAAVHGTNLDANWGMNLFIK